MTYLRSAVRSIPAVAVAVALTAGPAMLACGCGAKPTAKPRATAGAPSATGSPSGSAASTHPAAQATTGAEPIESAPRPRTKGDAIAQGAAECQRLNRLSVEPKFLRANSQRIPAWQQAERQGRVEGIFLMAE